MCRSTGSECIHGSIYSLSSNCDSGILLLSAWVCVCVWVGDWVCCVGVMLTISWNAATRDQLIMNPRPISTYAWTHEPGLLKGHNNSKDRCRRYCAFDCRSHTLTHTRIHAHAHTYTLTHISVRFKRRSVLEWTKESVIDLQPIYPWRTLASWIICRREFISNQKLNVTCQVEKLQYLLSNARWFTRSRAVLRPRRRRR